MELEKIVAELKQERDRLERAIAALEGVGRVAPVAKRGSTATATKTRNKRGGMSAATRKRLSEALKKRWAERRKKSA